MTVETIQSETTLKIEPLFINLIINQFREINQLEKEEKTVVIPWEDFTKRSFEISFRGKKYGFNIASSESQVSDFLCQMVQSRQAGKEAYEKFLQDTEQLDDEFFLQPVGKFQGMIIPLFLQKVNRILNELLSAGVYFQFNDKG